MDGTKEADLVTSVILYAMRCLAEGDHTALRHMNFGIKEIESLRDLRVADLYRIESLRSHCLAITLNRETYWPMIDNLCRQRDIEDTIHVMIVADAPWEMMHVLFGLNPRDYTRLRRTLIVDPAIGRPPEVDDEGSHRLWASWSARIGSETTDLLTPEQYLDIHKETEVPMRAIWTQTQRFALYGDLNGPLEAVSVSAGDDE